MRTINRICVVAVGMLALAACDRTRETAEPAGQETASVEQQQRQEDAQRLEQRVQELEREWDETQQRISQRTDAAVNDAKEDIQREVTELKKEVAELRNINAENWWARYEGALEEEANELEQDVRQFARNWNPAPEQDQVGTAGDASGWEARRDRLVSRIEARVEQMENALQNAATGGGAQRNVEETRAKMGALREDAERLKNTPEEDWWDVTRDRLNEAVDRLEAAIERLGNDSTDTNRPRG